jgi:hypothetical protein
MLGQEIWMDIKDVKRQSRFQVLGVNFGIL